MAFTTPDQKVDRTEHAEQDQMGIDKMRQPEIEVTDYAGAAKTTDPAEIRLVRKLDLRILSTLCVMYFLNYIDRNTLASARLNHLEKDLGMHGTDFNTAVSILFVGYVLMQIPSNMLITRIKPAIYMSSWMCVWAVVSGCTGAVQSYGGLLACRFFLGFTEAPFYPGAIYVLSIFYKRREVATRMAILYSAQILATGFTSLIASGIFAGLDGTQGLEGWRWLFILEGIFTFAVGVAGFWLLPNTPLTTSWLSPEERELAHTRMLLDGVETSPEDATSIQGFKQAVRDPRAWLFAVMQMFHLSAVSFNSFFPTVVKTLGFDTTVTLVLSSPPFIVAGMAGILTGWSSGRLHERTWHITIGLLVAIVGFIIAASDMTTGARYTACFIFPIGTYAVNSVIIGWASSTVAQTKEKKAVALAMLNVSGQFGYIYGPYMWPSSDGPRYAIGFGASAGFCVLCIATVWIMRLILKRDNIRIKSGALGGEDVKLYGI